GGLAARPPSNGTKAGVPSRPASAGGGSCYCSSERSSQLTRAQPPHRAATSPPGISAARTQRSQPGIREPPHRSTPRCSPPTRGIPTPRIASRSYTDMTPGAAAQEYAAVLAADPWNSHATYRLAQLHRHDPRLALRLFRRYVALEPSDPWGYMALAEMLARAGRYSAALRCYDDALRLAPDERDAVV